MEILHVNPASLATSGIYLTGDLDCLRNHIMFPMEKPSMLNTITREGDGGAHTRRKYIHDESPG